MTAALKIEPAPRLIATAFLESWGPGALEVSWSDAGLTSMRVLGRAHGGCSRAASASARSERALPAAIRRALSDYLSGDGTALAALPVDIATSPFGARVYELLRAVPFGAVSTYGELARRAGRPAAARGVGQLMNRNPIALAIPCHRVIGANGSLTGYAGGLDVKRWLLEHETHPRGPGHAVS